MTRHRTAEDEAAEALALRALAFLAEDPERLERSILEIPGVVGTGLFLGMADVVLVPRGGAVEVMERRR